jgi:hypothetical protein
MHTFKTLQELLDYIPQCIICQKPMRLIITGGIPSRGAKNYWHQETINLKMELFEGKLRSKNKNWALIIDPWDNQVSTGLNIVNDLLSYAYSKLDVYKKCWTCNFKINGLYQHNNKKVTKFPEVNLHSEELHYTMNRDRTVRLFKHYADTSFLGERTIINVNHRELKSIPLNFEKIQNLDQLNHKLKTLMTFQ